MRVLVIFAHPTPDSFNGALRDVVVEGLRARGAEVRVRDLYADRFQPVLDEADLKAIYTGARTPLPDVLAEQKLLSWATRLVFLYPVWWVDRPAVLKGWIDRVFLPGFAFQPARDGSAKGLLRHEKALVLQTAGNPEAMLRANGTFEIAEKTMGQGTLGYCGIPDVRVETLCEVTRVSDEERSRMLARVASLISNW